MFAGRARSRLESSSEEAPAAPVVDDKPRGMWQWLNAQTAGAEPHDAAVQAVADDGVASASGELPFREQIQASFGPHDMSGIRAQVGGPAARSAQALGARAYATGDRLAFAHAPDLHTAAHEAAHVVQQRSGVSFKGLDGGAGDPHERQADQAADAVVAGQSAAASLPASPTAGAAPAARAVQRKPAGTAPPATAPAPQPPPAPAPYKPEDAYQAPSSAKDPNAPAARNADYQQIQQAAVDPKTAQNLDIDWIDSLPDHLKNSIDADFADDIAAHKIKEEAKPGIARVDKDYAASLKQLHDDTSKRLVRPGHKPSEKEIATDPQFVEQKKRLDDTRATDERAAVDAARAAHDGSVAIAKPKQTVAQPTAKTGTRMEGKALARTNFMSWAVDVLGSAAAVKTHFSSIRQVKGHPDMWLAGAAATRFEAAQLDFESRNPGYTFVDTSVADELRGMHQQRWGIGMLGHALAEAFDFKAIDNPNIRIDDNGHSHEYMIAKFGGVGMKRGSGRARTKVAEGEVESVGASTAAGKTGPATAALVDKVNQQFDEMVQTSERLKASMAPHMAELQKARNLYFNQASLRTELASAKAAVANPAKAIRDALKDQTFATPEDRKAAEAEVKKKLQDAVDTKTAALAQSQNDVAQTLTAVFSAWTASIQADIDKEQGLLDGDQASRDGMSADEKSLDAVDATAADADAQLDQFAAAHNLTPSDKMRRKPKDAKSYKQALATELTGRDRKARVALAGTDSDARLNIEALKFYQQKLMEPAFVFGKGHKVDADNWATTYDVSQVPLMQLLEHGTVRNDPMPARDGSGGRKGVYNGDVVSTLAKFGWAPGANFGDTMHFDFIEGYNKAVPGGRSGKNLNKNRYSPEGDALPPPPGAAKAPAKK